MAMNGYMPIGTRVDKKTPINAKIGSRGPRHEYSREKIRKEGRLALADDESLEQQYEAEVLVNKIIGEIETWAGESLQELLNAEVERGLNEKIDHYAKRLAGLLKTDKELKNQPIVADWIAQLEKIK